MHIWNHVNITVRGVVSLLQSIIYRENGRIETTREACFSLLVQR